MKSIKRAVLALGLVGLLGASTVAAQSVELYGAWSSLSGNDFNGVNSGIGGGGIFLFDVGSVMVGAGGSYISYGEDGGLPDIHVIGVTGDVRYPIYHTEKFKLAVAGRGGYLHASASQGGVDAKASGYLFGGELIGMLPLGSGKISLVGAGGWSHVHFGDFKVNGTTVSGSSASGGNITARFGLSIGLH